MKSFEENPNVIDGLIYLKITRDHQVKAFGDIESLQMAEKEMKTGHLFDFSVTPEEWNSAFGTARIVDGKLILGLPNEVIVARQEEAIRNERYLRLRKCDKMSPMHWNVLTEDQKKEWADYRIALLNIPQQDGFPWGGNIENAPWPKEPDC